MRAVLSFLLLVAVCLVLADSAYGRRRPPTEDENTEKCERAFPRREGRLRCKYLCKGWPFRRGKEDDGTICSRRRGAVTGRCLNGRCVADKGQWTTEQPGRSTPEPSSTSTPSDVPQP